MLTVAFRNCWVVWLCFVFWVVTHFHCKEPSIHWIWMNSLVHIRIHPATSLCSHIIKNTTGPVPLADTHAYTVSTMFARWWNIFQLIRCSFSSENILIPIILVQVYLVLICPKSFQRLKSPGKQKQCFLGLQKISEKAWLPIL